MKYTVLSKELLDYWSKLSVKASVRRKFLLAINLSINSAKTDIELNFMSDCAYIWAEKGKCLTMKWEELAKIDGEFLYISSCSFRTWFTRKPINTNTNENRLQKQKTDVVRGDDTEGNRVQSRKRKAAVTVGYLATKQAKAKAEAELEAAKHSYPLDTQTIIELQDEVEAYAEGLEKLEALMIELF